MNLGKFSVSLAVKDLAASKAFYEKLGFTKYDGDEAQNWLIMKSGSTVIGLFQGMFPNNILTFNPEDGRKILQHVRDAGLTAENVNQEEGDGPMSFTLTDPDGNALLFDQHDAAYMRKLRPKGRVVWSDLTVPDAENVRDFYKAVLNWESEEVSMGDYADYNMMSDGDIVAGICHRKGFNEAMPSQWMNYFRVADLDASLAQAKERGGNVLIEPRGDEGNRFAVIEDPAGAVCALME
jgi:predicted enzyme related to lactoylglutathione lyase